MRTEDKVLIRKEDLLQYVTAQDIDVLVTFGAGDIGEYVDPLRKMIAQ